MVHVLLHRKPFIVGCVQAVEDAIKLVLIIFHTSHLDSALGKWLVRCHANSREEHFLLMLQHINSVKNSLWLESLFVLFSLENILEFFWIWKTDRLHFNCSFYFGGHAFVGIWIILNLNGGVFFLVFTWLRNLRTVDAACVLNATDQSVLTLLLLCEGAPSSLGIRKRCNWGLTIQVKIVLRLSEHEVLLGSHWPLIMVPWDLLCCTLVCPIPWIRCILLLLLILFVFVLIVFITPHGKLYVFF